MAAVSDFDESSTTQVPDADVFDTMNAPLEYAPESEGAEGGFSLFWRTFFLLSLLLLGSSVGWYQLFRTLEYEPDRKSVV